MNQSSAFGVVLACLFALSGCGGGGGGGGGSAPIPTYYTIGGTVSGLLGSGLTLHNGSENLPIGANGPFTFVTAVASGATYSVTATNPSSPTQTCTVTNGSGTASANVTNVQVNCIRTVGGTVTGLKGSGLVLANNNGVNIVLLAIGDNGSFNFPAAVAIGTPYNVTISTQPSPRTQDCTVANGSGMVGTNSVTTVSIDCGTWTRQLGSTPASTPDVVNDDFSLATATDASGNIYVTGYTQGDLPGTLNPDATHIFAAAYVVKYDKYGKKLWTREFGNNPTTEHLLGRAIATDGFGHVYVAGSTLGNFDGHTRSGTSDLFVVQFDQDTGARGWSAQLGAAGTVTHTYGIATDGSGNVYVAGSTSGSLDGQSTLGGYDLFVAKYNSNGSKQWTRQFGSSADDKIDRRTTIDLELNGNIIATDNSGNVYVTGYTFGNMLTSPDGYTNPVNPNGAFTDAVVAKINTNGALQWTRQFGTSVDDKGNGITLDASGNVYVAGMTDGILTGTHTGAHNVFVVKYGSDGGGSSGIQAGLVQFDGDTGGATTIGYGVVTDDASGVYVAGTVYNIVSGRYDLLMLKFNQSLVREWTRILGVTSGDTKGFGIAFDSVDNAIYATGFTEGGLDGNINAGTSSTSPPPGLKDIFLVKYNQFGTRQ